MFGTDNFKIPRVNSDKLIIKKQKTNLAGAKKKDERRGTVFVHHVKKKMSNEEKF